MSGSRLACVALIIASTPSSGCVTLAHEAGWFDFYEDRVTSKESAHNVIVKSEPKGAAITRTDPSGRATPLGVAPLVDQVPLRTEEHVEAPRTGALWIGAGVEFVVGFAGMIAGVTSVSGRDSTESKLGSFLGLATTGSLIVTSAMIDGIAAFIHGAKEPRVTTRTPKAELRYAASLDGLPEASAQVLVPDSLNVTLSLGARAETAGPERRWVVAVMSIEDASGATKSSEPALLGNLTDQIRVFVARHGIPTIDRGAQDAALTKQIASMKSESYQACYDSSCQIELGKALAASHILRTRITRFGSQCVLNGELIDLRTEVAVAAASSQGACEAEGLLEMTSTVARQITEAQTVR